MRREPAIIGGIPPRYQTVAFSCVFEIIEKLNARTVFGNEADTVRFLAVAWFTGVIAG
jgi:hypothetical protein